MGYIVRCLWVGVLFGLWAGSTQPAVKHRLVCAQQDDWIQMCQVDAGCHDYVRFCDTYQWEIIE